MKILFIHPNFPGQFKHLVKFFAKNPNNEVIFICTYGNNLDYKNVKKIYHKPAKDEGNKTHRYLKSMEKAAYAAQSVWKACSKLKEKNYIPDVIYAHAGWGDSILLKDIFPEVPFIAYMEYYYHAFGGDANYNPNRAIHSDKVAKVRFNNAHILLSLESCDYAVSPTEWQASRHPEMFRDKFKVIHEGIDIDYIEKIEKLDIASFKDKTIITYAARNFESYRGFEQVMCAIELLMKKNKDLYFVMIGNDEVSYGHKLPNGETHRERMSKILDLDHTRITWLGPLSYEKFIAVLKNSTIHIYLTVPFVLSWSLLESMACGCSIISSDTEPVKEVITDQENGILVDFFDHHDIAKKVLYLLENKELRQKIGQNAKETIKDRFDLKKILPEYVRFIENVANKKTL